MAKESKAESEHLHKARGAQRSYRPRRSGRGRRGRAGRGQPPAPPRPVDQTATARESPEASPMEAPPEGVEHENENVEPQGGGSETGEDMPNQTLPPAEAGEFEGEPAELEGGHEQRRAFRKSHVLQGVMKPGERSQFANRKGHARHGGIFGQQNQPQFRKRSKR